MITALDWIKGIVWKTGLVPAARTASTNSSGIDRFAAPVTDGRYFSMQLVGVVSGTTPTWDTKLQESDDNSTWTDIVGATHTQVTATGTVPEIIQFIPTKRYVRTNGTIGGTSTPTFNITNVIGAAPHSLN